MYSDELPILPIEEIYFSNIAVLKLFQSSLNGAEYMLHTGQISQNAFNWYSLFWSFTAWRFSCPRQERYYNKVGLANFKKRMEKMQKLQARIEYLLRTNQIKGL